MQLEQSASDFAPLQKAFQDPVSLSVQLKKLAEIGIHPKPGVTIDDFLSAFPEAQYENGPYDVILFVMAGEIERAPWGRYYSDQSWNFDFERITGDGSYVDIIENLLRVSGDKNRFINIADHVDFETNTASIRYEIPGKGKVEYIPKVNSDWADPDIMVKIVRDIERHDKDKRTFWYKDNGQSVILFFLTATQRQALDRLTGQPLLRFQ